MRYDVQIFAIISSSVSTYTEHGDEKRHLSSQRSGDALKSPAKMVSNNLEKNLSSPYLIRFIHTYNPYQFRLQHY